KNRRKPQYKDEKEAVTLKFLIFSCCVVIKKGRDHLRSIKRRKRNQVKDRDYDINHHCKSKHFSKLGMKNEILWNLSHHNCKAESADDCQDDIGEGASEANPKDSSFYIFKLTRINGNWLGPTKHDPTH